jgi:hypothetical protein
MREKYIKDSGYSAFCALIIKKMLLTVAGVVSASHADVC